jgi:hypothetical protein
MKTFWSTFLIAAASAAYASGPTLVAQNQRFREAVADPGPAEDAAALSLSDDEARSRMNAFLGSIDTPISAQQWAALGTRVGPWLEEIAKSTSELPTRRAKAIDGLIGSKWSRSSAVLRELSRDESVPANVRFHSVRGLGQLLAKDKVERELTPVLEGAKDARVRAVAAEQISKRAGRCGAIQRQLLREEENHKDLYYRAIATCGLAKPSGAKK